MPDARPGAEVDRGALRHRARRARSQPAPRAGRDRRPDRPERRRQVDDAAGGDAHRAARRRRDPAARRPAARRARGRRARRASRSCPRAGTSSARSPWRRTCASGSPGGGARTASPTTSTGCTASSRSSPTSRSATPGRSRAGSSSSSRSPARCSRGPTCCCSTSRRSGSRRPWSRRCSRRSGRIREAGVTILLVEQRGALTISFADRTHVLSNAELRLTLTAADAAQPEELAAKLTAAYLS